MATLRVRLITALIILFKSDSTHGDISDRYTSEEDQLMMDLFKLNNYSSISRPIGTLDKPVNVEILVVLTQLINVDVKYETIKSRLWIHQTWHDPRLEWNETKYGGLQRINVPVDLVWTPDTAVINTVANDFKSYPYVNVKGLHVDVNSNGLILKVTPMMLTTPCFMNVVDFPVDKHQCFIEFSQWAYFDALVLLQNGSDSLAYDNYLPNSGWDVVKTSVRSVPKSFLYENITFTSVVASLTIQRKTTYFIVNVIIPFAFMSLLTGVTFCLPSNSADKVNLSVTLLLTMYVFNLMVIDFLPVTSQQLPILTAYLLYVMGIICFSVASTILVSQVYARQMDYGPVPEWIKWLLFGRIARILHVQVVEQKTPINENSNSMENNDQELKDVNTPSSSQYRQRLPTFKYSKPLCKPPRKCNKYSYPSNVFKKEHKFRGNVILLMDETAQRMEVFVDAVTASNLDCNEIKVTNDWPTLAKILDRIFLVVFLVANITGANVLNYVLH